MTLMALRLERLSDSFRKKSELIEELEAFACFELREGKRGSNQRPTCTTTEIPKHFACLGFYILKRRDEMLK